MPRKKKAETEVASVMDWAVGKSNFGTPTMVLLPSRNYHFKVQKGEHKITVPRAGKYAEIAPEIFEEKDGEFDLYDEKNKVMYLPAITKILFATIQYPDLKSNELFAPVALVFNKDTVDIIGQVVEMLPPPAQT